MTTIVTHNGDFHTDDVFAVATLQLVLGKKNDTPHVIRTRDAEKIDSADYVVDVGTVYDEKKGRFDHHQIGGAGKRENGIPYAAFGLVWKMFGVDLAGSEDAAKRIDATLVQPVDAHDNGMSITTPIFPNVRPYSIQNVFYTFIPTWKEEQEIDQSFFAAVELAKKILMREIQIVRDEIEGESIVEEIYKNTADKRIVVMDERYPWEEVFNKHQEVLYAVYPHKQDDRWYVKAVRENSQDFKNRKDLPQSWAGKRGKELAELTGVPDAYFCHNMRFVATAETKEGAIALAQKALEN